MTLITRRHLLRSAAAAAVLPSAVPARAARKAVCGIDLSRAAFNSVSDWDSVFEARWGPLGTIGKSRILEWIGARDGVYDDRDGVLAWILGYWVRAFVTMADLTGAPRHMDAAASLIAFILDHTDARRVARGEIVENYARDPLYFRGTGEGGPFWKRGDDAIVLNTGHIANPILRFADLVFRDADRFGAYMPEAVRTFTEARIAVDAFDNDWQVVGDKGSYHYRDSQGSGQLGTTRTAFNQSATMMTAEILLDRWRPNAGRVDKIGRLVRYWLEDFADFRPDGTVSWPYMIHPTLGVTEDVGHASIDVDFLVAAFDTGRTDLTEEHMATLARTFLEKIYDGRGGLNRFVDGTTEPGFGEHWNAAIGFLELARFAPRVADVALNVFNAKYPPDAPDGILWARPMLGWATLLKAAATPC
ncbi:hypothetical protein GGD81_003860 [Rhodobium orientis]|uniref:Glycosyl hydrolase n=1 Tax=Rhodobium orientis TaxID=34017 RepID=A0A327JP15_9HYPH|nr:hypothetical protein [Rhodobium orientis]MBB4304796.1 hypothetical protein [Rhodobium orientis]MBK5948030.1 hypothetical protein [Rhodobium orientis]RAI27465.1 hypothetical protein CH339_10265 [Rhodobium orientis]